MLQTEQENVDLTALMYSVPRMRIKKFLSRKLGLRVLSLTI